ncbi:hypothetical protein BDR04DRAFT_674125 [Suillus decipiens]|nr:hypothetical protein BDR04DRAFT_674125 [Suillus decipiens]
MHYTGKVCGKKRAIGSLKTPRQLAESSNSLRFGAGSYDDILRYMQYSRCKIRCVSGNLISPVRGLAIAAGNCPSDQEVSFITSSSVSTFHRTEMMPVSMKLMKLLPQRQSQKFDVCKTGLLCSGPGYQSQRSREVLSFLCDRKGKHCVAQFMLCYDSLGLPQTSTSQEEVAKL